MALPTQLLAIPFRAGLDEKTADQVLEPGQGFVTIENRVQSKAGGFDKRPGFSQQTKYRQDGSTRTNGVSLFSLGNQTCVYDGSRLDVSSTASSNAVLGGYRRNLKIENLSLNTQSSSVGDLQVFDGYSVVSVGNYLVTAHLFGKESAGFVYTFTWLITISDAATGTTMLEHEVAIEGRLKLGVAGNKVIAFYVSDAAPNTISAIDIDVTTVSSTSAAWSSPVSVATDYDGSDYDVSSLTDLGSAATHAYLSYTTSTIPTFLYGINTRKMTAAGTTVASGSILTTSAAQSVGTGGDSTGSLIIAYSRAATTIMYAATVNVTTLIQTLAAVAITPSYPGPLAPYRIGVVARTLTTFAVVAGAQDANASPLADTAYAIKVECSNAGPVSALATTYGVGWIPISKPFIFGGRLLCQMAYVSLGGVNDARPFSNQQRTEILLDLGDVVTDYFCAAANVNMRLSSWANYAYPAYSLGSVAVTTSAVYLPTYLLKNAPSQAVGLVKLTVDGPLAPAQSHYDGVHVPGSTPYVFDGAWLIEDGWVVAPEISVDTKAGTALVGSYSYCAIFERTDSMGNVVWSGTSEPKTITTLVGHHPYVTVQGYDASALAGAPYGTFRVVLYRTTDNGTVFYRVGSQESFTGVAQFEDTMADALLETMPVLYRQPGTIGTSQPRQAPPAFSCETIHQDRLFGANGKNVWYSAVAVQGESTWFSDAFQFPVEGGGNITALSSQDGHLYIFKSDRIFYVDGQGPPENGGNGTEFSSPIELPTTVGCVDPRSVVRTQAGIMFQSTRGIELLTRKQEVMWIGEGVDDHVASFPVCTSAVLDEATSRVMFTLAQYESPSALGSGCILVYDFTVNMWSVTTLDSSVALNVATSAIVPTSGGLVYALLAGNGTVLNENQNEGIDRTLSPVSQVLPVASIETPWIKMAGLGGYQRTRRVQVQGERLDPHDLIVSVAYDFSPTYTQTRRWTWTELSSFAAEDVEIHLKTQKCQALRIKIEDAPPTGGTVSTGKGCTLFGLTIEWGAKLGTNKLPAGQRS